MVVDAKLHHIVLESFVLITSTLKSVSVNANSAGYVEYGLLKPLKMFNKEP